MNTRIENLLARLFLVIITLVLLVICNAAFGQAKMLMPWETEYNEVEQEVANWPGFIQTGFFMQSVQVESEYMMASYAFEEGRLKRMDIVRNYGTWSQAHEGLQVYLIWFERKGGLVFPQILEKGQEKYIVMDEQGGFELEINKKFGKSELSIHAWRKGEGKAAGEMQFCSSLEP